VNGQDISNLLDRFRVANTVNSRECNESAASRTVFEHQITQSQNDGSSAT